MWIHCTPITYGAPTERESHLYLRLSLTEVHSWHLTKTHMLVENKYVAQSQNDYEKYRAQKQVQSAIKLDNKSPHQSNWSERKTHYRTWTKQIALTSTNTVYKWQGWIHPNTQTKSKHKILHDTHWSV